MRRREFIVGVGGAALVLPLAVRAQPTSKAWRIGLFDSSSPEAGRLRLWDAFRQQMRELGYVEGDTVVFEPRWAKGRVDRALTLAAELVDLKVDVIATTAWLATQAATRATNRVPIVMAAIDDPVSRGFVASLNRPGGNVTGLATIDSDLIAKRLEFLREVVPQASRLAMIWEAGNEGAGTAARNAQNAAQALGISLQSLAVRGAEDFDGAFAAMVRDGAAALVIGASAVLFAERTRLADLATKHRLPTTSNERSYAEAGCLMAYGNNFSDSFRRAADYVDKILKGAKPGELPIERPAKFELVVNLKTAKALGLTLPLALLAGADEVIE
jgi:putative tryptophan/tyrosine transport system substrate-binding protein